MDIHPFVSNRPLILGGIEIPHSQGLEGHSDADALLHALVDALLGATGRGDIGTRFSNSDERWRGAKSTLFLESVISELSLEGWRVVNTDITVLCQAPKLAPYFPAMKELIAPMLGIAIDRIALKATTTESLGFVGRGEGVCVFATVLLIRA